MIAELDWKKQALLTVMLPARQVSSNVSGRAESLGIFALVNMDKYISVCDLRKNEKSTYYKSEYRNGSSEYLVAAPHGGGIEPGTTELADNIAGEKYNFYCFDGRKKMGNKELHVASENFDDTQALKLAGESNKVISIHGAAGEEKNIYIGGLDKPLCDKLATALKKAGFPVSKNIPSGLKGESHSNICNKGKSKQGVQFEITHGLRKTMFKSMDKNGRKDVTKKFDLFVETVQKVLNETEKR